MIVLISMIMSKSVIYREDIKFHSFNMKSMANILEKLFPSLG